MVVSVAADVCDALDLAHDKVAGVTGFRERWDEACTER
jgi:hypothetical protein